MDQVSKQLNIDFEKALRMLAQHMPLSDENSRKPVLFHDIRVGVYLYEHGYSKDIVLAGVLHDVIEWSDATEAMIRKEFGNKVAELIQANTKNDSIVDSREKTQELIGRCAAYGKDALVIKIADIIDSFKWYSSQENEGQLQYCMRNTQAIIEKKPLDMDDDIYNELVRWHDTYLYLTKQ